MFGCFVSLLYFLAKLFYIATCPSIFNYLKFPMFDLHECVCNVSTIIMIFMFIYLTIFFLSYSFVLSIMTSLVYDLTMYNCKLFIVKKVWMKY